MILLFVNTGDIFNGQGIDKHFCIWVFLGIVRGKIADGFMHKLKLLLQFKGGFGGFFA